MLIIFIQAAIQKEIKVIFLRIGFMTKNNQAKIVFKIYLKEIIIFTVRKDKKLIINLDKNKINFLQIISLKEIL